MATCVFSGVPGFASEIDYCETLDAICARFGEECFGV